MAADRDALEAALGPATLQWIRDVSRPTRRRLRRHLVRLKIIGSALSVRSLDPDPAIPFASVDMSAANPIGDIVGSPVFSKTRALFAARPAAARSLVSDACQALIFTLLRNLAPDHAVEIGGTFSRVGTSEAMALCPPRQRPRAAAHARPL